MNQKQLRFLNRNSIGGIAFLILLTFISCKKDGISIQFDSNMEVSGMKFSLDEISRGLPANWDEFEFVVLEFMISTPQRFQVGFTTDEGYNEVRVMSYTPNGWNRLAIPLSFYREPPAARIDLAATYNQPRYTGWINLTGHRTPLRGVDSIGIRMNAPIGNPIMKLRSISLVKEDPGDQYLDETPVVDEFGQYNLGDWEGKIHSLGQLQEEWKAEDEQELGKDQYRYSKFGGYLEARINEGSGFFRTEKIDGKWWFVDPEGYLFLAHGVNCVGPGGGGGVYRLEQRQNLYKVLPPAEPARENSRHNTPSFGRWNLQRRYGADYGAPSIDNIITRMDRWGLNTIANWSRSDVYERNQKAFTLQMRGIGIESTNRALEKHDPNHLSLGIRFGQEAENEILEICKDVFDVFSFNCYDLYPREEMLNRFSDLTGKPLFIGEYHFGTVDRGMAQSLWQVNSQEERGVAYRYYTEQGYSHPGLIGTSYFQWCDQDLTGRGGDGENYNCGLVDVTDRPYPYLVEAVSETAKRIFQVHSGSLPPFDQAPVKACGHGAIPDLWSE